MLDDIGSRRAAVAARHPVWKPVTLDGWLDARAEEHADRPLVLTDRVSYTYAEVQAASCALAAGLRGWGIGPGDRVAILMANYAEFVPLKFAIARTGAVAVPLNFLYRRDELAYVLEQSQSTVLVTMAEFAGLDYLSMLDDIVPGWDSADLADRTDGPLPRLRRVVTFRPDGPRPRGAVSLAELASSGAAADAATSHPPGHCPTDLADMLYTSGSTGSPKGVMVSHDAVLRTAFASALTRAYQDGRRILFSLPCYHMFGYVEGLLSAMVVGGSVVMQTSFTPAGYLAAVEEHRVDDLLCVPTMAVALAECPDRHTRDLGSLTAVLCGSAPAPVWLWERFEQDLGVREIVTGYGMTECGGAMTLTLPEDPLILTSRTVGRPKLAGAASVPGTEVLCTYRTVDPLTGEALPPGAAGELVSAGPTMMAEYFGKPEETEATLRGGEVHSGDLGFVDPDGYLVLTGRSKELYKSGGELVMPKEVEEVLASHPEVSQAFAIGVHDERWGEIGCAVVVPVEGCDPSEESLLGHCKERLARFKVPKRVVFLRAEELPTTATGKVQKHRLLDLVAAS